jgi:hypothetical protein
MPIAAIWAVLSKLPWKYIGAFSLAALSLDTPECGALLGLSIGKKPRMPSSSLPSKERSPT